MPGHLLKSRMSVLCLNAKFGLQEKVQFPSAEIDLRCISGRTWGSEWLRPTPGGWRFPAGWHTGRKMTCSRERRQAADWNKELHTATATLMLVCIFFFFLLNKHHKDTNRKRETLFPSPRHTLDSIPILMMLPVMVKRSLMISRMYQPLMNSRRSDQHTLRPRMSRKYCTYS